LTEIWRARSGARAIHAAQLSEEASEGLSMADAIAVENLDSIGGREEALFHLLNRARELGATVLLTGRDRERILSPSLPELRSRLRAAQPLSVDSPDDALLGMVLVKLFADRQLAVPPGLIEYLVRRMERSYAAAALLVRKLDEAALATGRPISRQLAAPFLSEAGPDLDTEGN
jgi:chromosomal replication initiation ATPase DnaA